MGHWRKGCRDAARSRSCHGCNLCMRAAATLTATASATALRWVTREHSPVCSRMHRLLCRTEPVHWRNRNCGARMQVLHLGARRSEKPNVPSRLEQSRRCSQRPADAEVHRRLMPKRRQRVQRDDAAVQQPPATSAHNCWMGGSRWRCSSAGSGLDVTALLADRLSQLKHLALPGPLLDADLLSAVTLSRCRRPVSCVVGKRQAPIPSIRVMRILTWYRLFPMNSADSQISKSVETMARQERRALSTPMGLSCITDRHPAASHSSCRHASGQCWLARPRNRRWLEQHRWRCGRHRSIGSSSYGQHWHRTRCSWRWCRGRTRWCWGYEWPIKRVRGASPAGSSAAAATAAASAAKCPSSPAAVALDGANRPP